MHIHPIDFEKFRAYTFIEAYMFIWNSRVHIYLSISLLILAPDHTPLYPKTIQEKCWGQSPKILLVSLYKSISLTLNSRSFSTKKRPSASKWWILLELTPVLLAHLPRQMPWTITENPASTIQPPHNCTVDQEKKKCVCIFISTKNKNQP